MTTTQGHQSLLETCIQACLDCLGVRVLKLPKWSNFSLRLEDSNFL
jgi:hypothetical protein